MKKLILLILLSHFCLSGFAQKKGPGIHAGLVNTQGTFALGHNFDEWKYYVYFSGEVLISDHVGFDGSIYVNAGSQLRDLNRYVAHFPAPVVNVDGSDPDYFSHNLFAGLKYHFIADKPIDVFVGFQPGLGLFTVKSGEEVDKIIYPNEVGVAPLISLNTGIAYYASFFHIFAEVRAVWGGYHSAYYDIPLSEIRPSIGLGFNIN